MNDDEEQVARRLTDLADSVEFRLPAEFRADPTTRRPRYVAFASAAAVLLVGIVFFGLRDRPPVERLDVAAPSTTTIAESVDTTSSSSSSEVASAPELAPGWSAFALQGAPQEGAGFAAGGGWFLMWGGFSGPTPVSDGLLVNLDTGEQLSVDGSPLAARNLPSVTWVDSVFIVFGGNSSDEAFADGAQLDPATGEWTVLPTPPPGIGGAATTHWTGTELLVWSPSNFNPTFDRALAGPGMVASYDPQTREWLVLPTPPLQAVDADLFGDNGQIQLLGGPHMRDVGTTGDTPPLQTSRLDRDSGQWSAAIEGPPTESVRAALTSEWGVVTVDATGIVMDATSSIVTDLGPGCWWDVALAAKGAATYIKTCGAAYYLSDDRTPVEILDADDMLSTSNTYAAAFVTDDQGRLVTMGRRSNSSETWLGVYTPSE